MTERDVWIASNLHYARPTTGWLSRAALRELGYGPAIDAHIQRGACPADDWRVPPSGEVIELRRKRARTRPIP